ncbi:RapZ C-terminal domain-containing protein [Streptomyces sp. enrichment culture]|uniref:RapZ C-terminal domain-containing protein n=1 Tax=Streptomyces sp. enrichment culture TaxID=1795815 RepID=UPI003F57F899
MTTVSITSFGYLHGQEPAARVCYDLRHQFKDPHLRPELRYLTARDAPVREAVMGTDGVPALVHAIAATVDAYLAGPRQDEPLTVAVGCAGGRHRSATVADALAVVLSGDAERAAGTWLPTWPSGPATPRGPPRTWLPTWPSGTRGAVWPSTFTTATSTRTLSTAESSTPRPCPTRTTRRRAR